MPDLNDQQFGEGHWDRSGEEPRWVESHESLVRKALSSWQGWPTDMRIHIEDDLQGAPQPSSGSGKKMRAQAGALYREVVERAQPNPAPLYRGSHETPAGLTSWSEDRKVAETWARKGQGQVFERPPGTARGLRMSDYVGTSIPEKEWVVDVSKDDED